jgi:heme-degrading monooxygenase HmoA
VWNTRLCFQGRMAQDKSADDASNETPRASVYVVRVAPKDSAALLERIHKTLAYEVENLPGFLEAHVLVSDDRSCIIVESLWTSRHDWSHSRWDDVVQAAVADLHQSSDSVDLKFYGRREILSRL